MFVLQEKKKILLKKVVWGDGQDCWFILQIFYENFKKTTDGVTYDQNQLHFLSEQFNIPEGI